jgi:hypothetical protein
MASVKSKKKDMALFSWTLSGDILQAKFVFWRFFSSFSICQAILLFSFHTLCPWAYRNAGA